MCLCRALKLSEDIVYVPAPWAHRHMRHRSATAIPQAAVREKPPHQDRHHPLHRCYYQHYHQHTCHLQHSHHHTQLPQSIPHHIPPLSLLGFLPTRPASQQHRPHLRLHQLNQRQECRRQECRRRRHRSVTTASVLIIASSQRRASRVSTPRCRCANRSARRHLPRPLHRPLHRLPLPPLRAL